MDQLALVNQTVERVRRVAGPSAAPILLHRPLFGGRENDYVRQCIDTGWVSSAGSFVTDFERQLCATTGARYAVAVVNGTAALHVALMLAGVQRDTEVLMPSLTFVATANAAAYCGAVPHFCDISPETLGLDPERLDDHLRQTFELRPDGCANRHTGRRVSAIVPMHTFGHPVNLSKLMEVGSRWRIPVVEDAAESLGSLHQGKHTGTFGLLGVLSFNGNKIVTTGAGGAILTDDEELARRARHLTTTAKVPHAFEYVHDEVGYNYRMPNLNAALGCAQLEQLSDFVSRKRVLADAYADALAGVAGVTVFREPPDCHSNYWLNALILDKPDMAFRNQLLEALNAACLQSRPVWRPMHQLEMYKNCPRMELDTTEDLAARVVNIPSSAELAGGGVP